jgi:hypothetical protein
MGTKRIDTLQTAQITALETDVGQLRTKLNLVVDDALAISSKLNTLIGDLNDMNNLVMEGYTTPGSAESYGIQEAIDLYKDEWKDHVETHSADSRDSPSNPNPSWHWWPYGLSGTGSYNSASSGTLTGASWTAGSNAVAFTGSTGPMIEGMRLVTTGDGYPFDLGAVEQGIGAMIITIPWPIPTPLILSEKFNVSGSGTLSFVAKAGTIHYGTSWDAYWDHRGPWGQDWFEHPRMRRGGHSSAHSESSGAASYDNPVLGGTDQGTNSSHSADAIDASVIGQYPNKERLLSIEPTAANRAKKLVRNVLNKLRSK